ncbi:hypothetical protein EYZ11_013587 [Aspergillus tanneri]|uniref:GH18 domain-containing protein n=1 Tax=Aspergillus tanneri TaxID=1220188 RepID=A0A4S3IZF9_9EURO|nr:hypothetical protein EYZ11_013587 [Aspergillus tanneri]
MAWRLLVYTGSQTGRYFKANSIGMYFFTTVVIASLIASLIAQTVGHSIFTREPRFQTVVYWGQNGGGTVESDDLSMYWQSCVITQSGEPQNCDSLAAAIKKCQSNGVKVMLSLGGAAGAYSLMSRDEAETIGQNLWDAYGNSKNGRVPRPFGDVFVNGWDFDIESYAGTQYYPYLIKKLRSNFASDSFNNYYITGAPQCPIPEPYMQEIFTEAKFSSLWVQFYNNPGCSVNSEINYNGWVRNIANTSSADARIFIGVPASPLAATGSSQGSAYYLEPNALASLVARYKNDGNFGGIMTWSAGFSDANKVNGHTYVQHVKCILEQGQPCLPQ